MGASRSNKLSDDSGTIRRCRQTHRTCRREAANGFPQSRCKSSHKEEAPRKQVKSLNMSYLRELIEYKIIGTCVKGKWVYLYRAVDSSGATIDFLLSAKRDAAAAERFLAKALGGANHPHPRVINTDKYAAYPPAIGQLKGEGVLEENCQHRPVQYLNNVLEQDHRASNRRARAGEHCS